MHGDTESGGHWSQHSSVLARFSGRCYLYWRCTGNRSMPFSPVRILDVAHRDCLLVQAEGSEGLYCDQRKVMHGPGALPWVVILNVNCHKLWAITSLVSWIYYQHPALAIDLKVVLLYITMMWSELLLITSFNDITASWTIWLWPDYWCKGRGRSWKLHRVCGPQGHSAAEATLRVSERHLAFWFPMSLQDWGKYFASSPLLHLCPCQAFFFQRFLLFHYQAPTLASAAYIIGRLFRPVLCLPLLYWFDLFLGIASCFLAIWRCFSRVRSLLFILSCKGNSCPTDDLGSI